MTQVVETETDADENLYYGLEYISAVIDHDPLLLFPFVLGEMNTAGNEEDLFNLLTSHSYLLNEENNEVEFSSETYAELLELTLRSMYQNFNFFVQMVSLRTAAEFTSSDAHHRIPQDSDFTEALKSNLPLKLLVKAFIREDFRSLSCTVNKYTIDQYVGMYKLMPSHAQEFLAEDIQAMTRAVYPGDTELNKERDMI